MNPVIAASPMAKYIPSVCHRDYIANCPDSFYTSDSGNFFRYTGIEGMILHTCFSMSGSDLLMSLMID